MRTNPVYENLFPDSLLTITRKLNQSYQKEIDGASPEATKRCPVLFFKRELKERIFKKINWL